MVQVLKASTPEERMRGFLVWLEMRMKLASDYVQARTLQDKSWGFCASCTLITFDVLTDAYFNMRNTKTPNADLFLVQRVLPDDAYFFPKIIYERNTTGSVSSGPSGLKVYDVHGSTFELDFQASTRQKGNLMLTRANQTMMHAAWPTGVRVTQFGTEAFELARVCLPYMSHLYSTH